MNTAIINEKVDLRLENRIKQNMFLLLAGKFVSVFGTFIFNFAVSLYVLKVTGSGMGFALSLILSMLPRIILGPVAGVVADKKNRKAIVVWADFLSGLFLIAIFLLTFFGTVNLYYIYAVILILAVLNTYFAAALDSSIPNLVDDKRLMRVNSLNQSITSLSQILSPIIGGIIFALVNFNVFLIIGGICFILSAISELFIDFHILKRGNEESEMSQETAHIADSGPKVSVLAELKDGLRYLKSNKALYALVWYACIFNFFFTLTITVPHPYLLNNVFKVSPTQFGVIEGFFSGGILIGSILLSLLPEREKKYSMIMVGLIAISLLLFLVGVPGLPQWSNISLNIIFIYYLIHALLIGFVNIFTNLPIIVTMQRKTPDQYRGRIMALIQTIANAISPLSVLIAGTLLEYVPAYQVSLVAGGIMVLVSLTMCFNKSLKEL